MGLRGPKPRPIEERYWEKVEFGATDECWRWLGTIRPDGRPLRRYCRRWKIKRLFAWLQNFRRILVRYDYDVLNYLGFVQLGCIVFLMRRCL